MINVKDFGAQGNGSTDDRSAITQALATAREKGEETVLFPAGEYLLKKPIVLGDAHHLNLMGQNATLLCLGEEGIEGSIGAGGGLQLMGNRITVEALHFKGHVVENYSSEYGYGKLLRLRGNHNTVQGCHFRGGNAGGIEISGGNYNTIDRNIFDKCNNYPPKPYTGDYGSIHLVGRCRYNTISNNRIINFQFSGISGYGTGNAGDFSDLYIYDNYLESASANRKRDHSMGIYLLNGANKYIEIIGNTINKADAECIVIFSKSSAPAEYCKIHNNVLLNGAYQGLSLRSQNERGTFRHCSIEGNLITNYVETDKYDHQMFLERFEQGRIHNNTLYGFSAKYGYGIYFHLNPAHNKVTNNKVSYQKTGIAFYGAESVLDNNVITHCQKGIRFAYCAGAVVINNLVTDCNMPAEYVTDKSQLKLTGNVLQ